jgi:glucose-1-phosphate thymidylyltransferase
MNIVVPMAGMGKRMRPHTLTVPKPLLRIAGKTIVQRLVEDIVSLCHEPVEEIAFIIGRFGKQVEEDLLAIAKGLGAQGRICYQDEPLGTAHAILCAKESLKGKTIVAFADTLFKADFKLDDSKDGVLWVKQIEDPSQFGVVKLGDNGTITDYVEKPETFVSDLAMIGIYYFKSGEALRDELQYLIDNNIIKGGEYQLPDALRNMTEKGASFVPGKVDEWMDCGNKDATVETNQRVLYHLHNAGENLKAASASVENSVINEPVYLGEGVTVKNAVVGPYVSIHANSTVENSVIENTIVYDHTTLSGQHLTNSMVGNHVTLEEQANEVSIGDYSKNS